jgi:hypothetical protein
MSFSPDGTKLYVADQQNSKILQYTLSTAWDASTISYASKFLDVSGEQGNSIYGVAISYDGSYIYSGTQSTGVVYQYKLSTAFDVSTGSYTNVSVSTSSQEAAPTSIEFDTSGKSMFITGFNTDTVYQYTIPDYPTASPVTVTGLTNGTSYTFNVWAINAFGWSVASDASGSVTPVAPVHGLMSYDSSGSAGNELIYVNIVTLGSASDFGAIGPEYNSRATGSSSTRAIVAGGQNSGGSVQNAITYTTMGTTGTGSDFGDLTVSRTAASGISNSTRMVIANGDIISNTSNVMDYITIASTGNATDFGDSNKRYQASSTQSTTRGLIIGGRDGSLVSDVRYITIASTGNSVEFGNAAPDGDGTAYGAAFSNGTRAVSAYGYKGNFVNSADMGYITIASTGNMTDYGDLTGAGYGLDATSSSTRGIIGHVGFGLNIDYVTIASTGNASDFGDLPIGSSDSNGYLGSGNMGGDHGGL